MSNPIKLCPFCDVALVERGDYNDESAWNWMQHQEESGCVAAGIRINSALVGNADFHEWNERPEEYRLKAERDRLKSINAELLAAVKKAKDSFCDIGTALRMLGHTLAAQACKICEDGMEEAIKHAEGK